MGYFDNIYKASPEELPSRARAVFMYLRDRTGGGQDCWPAVNTIAKDMNLSRSTVKRALNDLVQAGLLEKQSRYRENGSHTSNRLVLKRAK